MKKIIFVVLLVLLFLATGLYFYTYKSHRDISTEEASFTSTLSSLQKDFKDNDSLFNANYADKTIEIYGKITAMDLKNNSIMLDEKIAVNFSNLKQYNLAVSDSTYIKGRYVGYDDLLEEFKIDQAVVVDK